MTAPTNLMTIEEIDRLINEGATVNVVEALLDSLPIDPDEKSALWLRAWHHSQNPPRRCSTPGQYLG